MKRFCRNNHDTLATGRNKSGSCIVCATAAHRKWRNANREHYTEMQFYRDKEDSRRKNVIKASMFAGQGGLCLFCNKPLPEDLTKCALDHDHRCHPGQRGCSRCNRALLHLGCNVAVGLAERDIETAIAFLQRIKK